MGRHVEVQEYRYNLRPFFEIRRFFRMLRAGNLQAFAVNFLGNIVAFMPFGYFLPLLVKKCQNMFRIVLLSFELSLFVELIQLIFKLGCFDVDDLLLNTVGGLLGYLVYLIFYGRKNRDVP
jgi:glycopeptide antibiotics resistance protein